MIRLYLENSTHIPQMMQKNLMPWCRNRLSQVLQDLFKHLRRRLVDTTQSQQTENQLHLIDCKMFEKIVLWTNVIYLAKLLLL